MHSKNWMDAFQNKILFSSVISATVIGVLGIVLFFWPLPENVFPTWLRAIILIALFAHLFIRTSWAITSPMFREEPKEQYSGV